jgi:hypothetical protein
MSNSTSSDKDTKKTTLVYSHENNYAFKKKGVRHVHKEKILDGAKGLSFKFVMKVGDDDNDFYKVHARQEENGKFTVEEKSKGKETKKEDVSEADVMKMVKANKNLKFVVDYMKERKNYGAYAKKKSKKKKSTKKKSKKKKSTKKKSTKKSMKGGAKKTSKSLVGGTSCGGPLPPIDPSTTELTGGAKKSKKKKAKKTSKKKAKKTSKKKSTKKTSKKKKAKKTSKKKKAKKTSVKKKSKKTKKKKSKK